MAKGLYTDNYKTMLKEIKKTQMEIYLMFSYWKTNVKAATLPKVTYMFNTNPIKISMLFFTEIEKTILKVILNSKGT